MNLSIFLLKNQMNFSGKRQKNQMNLIKNQMKFYLVFIFLANSQIYGQS